MGEDQTDRQKERWRLMGEGITKQNKEKTRKSSQMAGRKDETPFPSFTALRQCLTCSSMYPSTIQQFCLPQNSGSLNITLKTANDDPM